MLHDAPLLTTMAAAFAAAWILGLVAQRLHLSPIVGYLLAGVAIGPYTPGFVGDVEIAGQLAEVGVILLMFGIGLRFQLKDLREVKSLAVPGALVQCTVATLLGVAVGIVFGWPVTSGLMLGMALSVASTVVLLRSLEGHNLLGTPPGHAAIGWLIVQDVLAVIVLVVIPALGEGPAISAPPGPLAMTLLVMLGKLGALVALVLLAGSLFIPWILVHVARLRSRELFTLTILALAVAIATGAAAFFGVSVALGAFLAGMVVGQSPVSHQAAADALPLRDAFAVLFFVSVGMLFEPGFLLREPLLFLSALGVVTIGNPLAALTVVAILGYSTRTALVVALGLAQIGEFSFILGDLALRHALLSETGSHLLVACALVSISVNPLLFRWLDPLEVWLRRRPMLWRLLNAAAARRRHAINRRATRAVEELRAPHAVVVGYGPVGQAVDRVLRDVGTETVVIDLNMDTVAELAGQSRLALYGDASHPEILKQAGTARARYLVVTLPHSINRAPLVAAARQINPDCRIYVRARYLQEREGLEQVGADAACFEEAEAAVALATRVLADLGVDAATIVKEADRVRQDTMGDSGVLA